MADGAGASSTSIGVAFVEPLLLLEELAALGLEPLLLDPLLLDPATHLALEALLPDLVVLGSSTSIFLRSVSIFSANSQPIGRIGAFLLTFLGNPVPGGSTFHFWYYPSRGWMNPARALIFHKIRARAWGSRLPFRSAFSDSVPAGEGNKSKRATPDMRLINKMCSELGLTMMLCEKSSWEVIHHSLQYNVLKYLRILITYI